MKKKVFVSYAYQDRHLVKPILNKLSQKSDLEDYSIDEPSEISQPGNIREIIKQRVKAANKVIVLWTENAANSQSVNYEIGMADALDKPITIVKTENLKSLKNPNLEGTQIVSLADL